MNSEITTPASAVADDSEVPINFTDSAAGRSRFPLQTGQSALIRNCATRRFIIALCVVAKVCSTKRRALEKLPW